MADFKIQKADKNLDKIDDGDAKLQESDSNMDRLIFFGLKKFFTKFKDNEGRNRWDEVTHKTRSIRKLTNAIKTNDTIAAIIGCTGLGVALYAYELYYDNKIQKKSYELPEDAS